MFQGCSKLSTLSNLDFSKLVTAYYMFSGCSSLTSFSTPLPKVTTANNMFQGCSSLTSFDSNLQSLTNARYMFSGCSNLESFSAPLTSLVRNAYGMFSGCKLNAASVQSIAENLPEYQAPTTSSEDLGNSGTITIHVNSSMSEEDKALVRTAF